MAEIVTNQTFPLTRSQSWVWAGQQLLPSSPMNNMAFAITTPAGTNKEYFLESIKHMISACSAMHLRLRKNGDSVVQYVEKGEPVVTDLSLHNGPSNKADADALLADRLANTVFGVGERLYDTAICPLESRAVVWYLNQHHLITDGWGKSLQIQYVFACYEALSSGRPFPEVPFQPYTNYLSAQPTPTANPDYWDTKAGELPEPPKLYGRGNPDREPNATRYTYSLGKERTAALEAVIAEADVRNWSPDLAKFTVFATVLYVFLYRVSGQRKLGIGTPAHNRITKTDKVTPGLYMELFPQMVEIEGEETFTSLLQKVKAETMDFLRYAKPGGSTRASNAGINVLLNYINQSFLPPGGTEVAVEWLHSGQTEPGHHLSIQVYDFEGSGVPKLSFDVNNAVIEEQIGRLVGPQFLEVLDEFLADRTQPITSPGTRGSAQTATFNTSEPAYPTNKTVVDLFYESVAKYGGRVAVVSEGKSLTYAELDRRSNQLANHLIGMGVKPEMPVAICLERSLEMMVGLLGILKSGGAYSPIDPDFPETRIGYLLEDTGAEIVVTTESVQGKLRQIFHGHVLALDTAWPEISLQPISEPVRRPRPEELMYIIHTSGSTGKPKGVMNRHSGPLNRLMWGAKHFPAEPGEQVFLQKTTFCFDVSVWELFWPLLQGMKLVMARPGGHKDDRYLREIIEEQGITIVHFVPSMLEIFLERAAGMPTLRQLFCSGEALTPHQVASARAKLPGVSIHNLYGPTEAGIEVTHWRVPDSWALKDPVLIGKPLPNAPIYLLNDDGVHCPVGVPGELYIGGIPVAKGYYGKPELTSERFPLRKIYADTEAERVYKTGDLARWLPSGDIEYLGRLDSQVKIRGYRIELGEIEATLLQMPEVARAQVLAKGEGQGTHLLAYVVADPAFEPANAQAFLLQMLPGYMVPTQYRLLPEMPVNANGKIDRKALAALAVDGPMIGTVPPATEFEEMVLDAWLDALGLEEIGVTTSFHDIGGHSLSAIRVINRVNETFELELAANTLFRFPTIRGLASHVESVIRKLMAEMDEE